MRLNKCVNCKKTWQSSHLGKFCSSNCNHLSKYHEARRFINFNRQCGECGIVFVAQRASTRFCSPKCNNLSLYKNRDIGKYNNKKRIYQTNPEGRARLRHKERYKSDTNYKLTCVVRNRFTAAVKNNHKSGSAVAALGCSIFKFKAYIESKFQLDMNWSNWSREGWHIDHIKPLSNFDLSDPKQFTQACHYTNLQPLWAKDNLKKGAKVCHS